MNAQNQPFSVIQNKLQFRSVDSAQVDGVQLTDEEQEYLLPHFLMLLVGKPGSGKTTLLKQLITNPQMYYRKFDDVLLVSPSHQKMGLKVKKSNVTDIFSLDWLFDKFNRINELQKDAVFGRKAPATHKNFAPQKDKDTLSNQIAFGDISTRFQFAPPPSQTQQPPAATKKQIPSAQMSVDSSVQKQYEHLKKLPREQQERTHRNILVVLDDVVGSIKKAEFDPRLSQLVMNRRHIIFNGTISIIMVTQKYTLIPARVRSNASWLILFQLNPFDFETVYRDSVVLSVAQWQDILQFVYGVSIDAKTYKEKKYAATQQHTEEVKEETKTEEEEESKEPVTLKVSDIMKAKKFENLGIWVETNIYFKNFKRLNL